MPSLRQQIDALLDTMEPEVAAAFREAIADIRSNIVLREVIEHLERRDVEGAIEALHVEPSAFRVLDEAIQKAYNAGGVLVTDALPRVTDPLGNRVVFRWDVRNIRAETHLREQSAKLIVGIVEDTKEMVRETITEGFAKGQGPRTIALDIAGRVNSRTKRREGSLVGLTAQQARAVANARDALLSGDTERMRYYLTLGRRDKRFDRSVMKAIEAGKPVDAATVDRIATRYKDRLLELRAEMIARTETLTAVHTAKFEAYKQGLEKANRDEALVERTWRSAGDGKVRHTHRVMNGQVVKGMSAPFVSPSGARMMHPGDTSFGAGVDEIAGCRCDDDIQFNFALELSRKRA